jgi:hypothetical protein
VKPETEAACEVALSYIERANAAIAAEATGVTALDNPSEMVRFYADLREQGERMRALVADVSKTEREFSYTLIPACFDRAGIKNVNVVGYGRVGLTHRWSCSMLDKEKGFAYLREHGQGGMIIETVAAPTLGAWAGAQVRDTGVEPPDDIFKTSVARSVSLERSK